MNFEEYRRAYFVEPPPNQRFLFRNSFGVTLFYEDFQEAVAFYTKVLGEPAYVEGEGTRGWPVGEGWLTLLQGKSGNPTNVEIALELPTVEEAEAMQRALLAAGAKGAPPSDQLMYRPVRTCPVTDPFSVDIMIIAPLGDDL